jgi:hypothetical protein
MENITLIDKILIITLPILPFMVYGISYLINYLLEKI